MTNVLCTTTHNSDDIFDNLKYLCQSTQLITDSLQRGCDVTQMPNGDIIITEVKVMNTQYMWDNTKKRMIRVTKSV